MKFFLLFLFGACLVFQASGSRITKVSLKLGNEWSCGGDDIWVKVCTSRGCCRTSGRDISRGVTQIWTGYSLGNCRNFQVDETPTVHFQTSSSDSYCPREARIRLANMALFGVSANSWHNYDNNDNYRRAYIMNPAPQMLTTPPPVTCPVGQGCPLNRVRAYASAGRAPKRCVFQCPTLVSADYANNPSNSGYQCFDIPYSVEQYHYCCKDGAIFGGMPACENDVVDVREETGSTGSGHYTGNGGSGSGHHAGTSGSGSGHYTGSSGSSGSGSGHYTGSHGSGGTGFHNGEGPSLAGSDSDALQSDEGRVFRRNNVDQPERHFQRRTK